MFQRRGNQDLVIFPKPPSHQRSWDFDDTTTLKDYGLSTESHALGVGTENEHVVVFSALEELPHTLGYGQKSNYIQYGVFPQGLL